MTRRESLVAMLGAVLGVSQKGIPGTRKVNFRNKARVLAALNDVQRANEQAMRRYQITVNRALEMVELFGPRILGR